MAKIDRTCERCGMGFQVDPSTVRRGKGRFCSRACTYEPKREAQCTCRACGKEFWLRASIVEKGRGGQFCSRKCHAKGYQPTFVSGPGERLKRPLIIREKGTGS